MQREREEISDKQIGQSGESDLKNVSCTILAVFCKFEII